MEEVHAQQARRPSVAEVVDEQTRRKSVDNRQVTGASQLTLRQSIVPVVLVTTLFFVWKIPLIPSARRTLTTCTDVGICLRSSRCSQLSFPGRSQHHQG